MMMMKMAVIIMIVMKSMAIMKAMVVGMKMMLM